MAISEYQKLKKNTIIIAVSNIGSKAISFILAPLYSFYLSTTEYGTMDLIITTAGLLLPILCLEIYQASFRFANDNKYDEKIVFSTSISLSVLMTIFAVAIMVMLTVFTSVPKMVFLSVLIATLDANFNVLSWFARGRGKMKVFAFSGILNSLIMLLFNVLFLILLRYGLYGWIISYLVAKIIASIYVFVSIHGWQLFSINKISKQYLMDAFKYCLPLIPTTSMWWVMNASDRYMISLFVGVTANGIYAVANKIPGLLGIFESVFYQAWQTSSIATLEIEERDEFYSDVFEKYLLVLAMGTLGILVILKPVIKTLFAPEYNSAWECASILVLAVLLHALSGNLGTLYGTFKKTKGALYSSIVGAVTNIALNFILIPWFGINAAAWTTLIGYTMVLIYRWFDIRKFCKISVNPKKVTYLLILLTVQLILYYIDAPISYFVRISIAMLVLIQNKNIISKVIKR